MTMKQWSVLISLVAQAGIAVWLVNDITSNDVTDATVAATATKLMWAILVMIVFTIVGSILVVIGVSIARGEEFKDEAADERDRLVDARSARLAYFVASAGGAGTLLALAWGVDPVIGAYALFAVLMLAGIVEGISKLILYRIG